MIFVPTSLVDNNPALVQVMAWRQTGDKPLPEPMLTRFTHAYMQHMGEMSLYICQQLALRIMHRQISQFW